MPRRWPRRWRLNRSATSSATCSAKLAYTWPFREISRPPVTRSAPVARRAVAPGAHLPAQEDDQADDERHANYQGRSQRCEVLPHGCTPRSVPADRGPPGSCRLVRNADAHFIAPVRGATACGCCPTCWALPAPGRETRRRPRHRNAIAPSTPLRPRECR